MAEGEDRIELKFRIFDGTDIAHTTYALSTAVATLKQRLVAEWPQGCWLVYLFMFPFFFLMCSIVHILTNMTVLSAVQVIQLSVV